MTQALINLHIDSGQMGKNIACKIDTGAVIPLDTCMQLHPYGSYDADRRLLDLTPSSTNITAFGGHVIKQYGTCLLTLTLNNSSNKHSFHVVDTTGPTILVLPTCRDMKQITLNYTITTRHLLLHLFSHQVQAIIYKKQSRLPCLDALHLKIVMLIRN